MRYENERVMMIKELQQKREHTLIPESASTVAAPPSRSMEVTMILAQKAKKRKVRWAALPQRARTISHMVCAEGATSLREMARTPKSSTWMVAPEAYLLY